MANAEVAPEGQRLVPAVPSYTSKQFTDTSLLKLQLSSPTFLSLFLFYQYPHLAFLPLHLSVKKSCSSSGPKLISPCVLANMYPQISFSLSLPDSIYLLPCKHTQDIQP